MKKEEKESEIEVLRDRVEELGRDIDKYINKRDRRIEKPAAKNRSKKYVWILVCLIVIVLVIDIIALFAYYKPDLSSFFKFNNSGSNSSVNGQGNGKCSDGTAEGTCSKDKPMFCYSGTLVKKASICGCPSSYVKDFQDCVQG